MGPQLGYYYPEIVEQIHLSGPGIEAQGVAVPGAAMYMLIGRTRDYAWSLTSADHDVRDVFAEQLCNPDGSRADAPVRPLRVQRASASRSQTFDAGTLNGTPIRVPDVGARTGHRYRDVARSTDRAHASSVRPSVATV